MKVTQIESQKRNPKRFNIYLDGKYAFGADEDLIVHFRLIVGKEVTIQDLQKLLYEAEVGKLIEKLYGYITIRQRSEKEIHDYLKQLSYKRKVKGQEEISDLSMQLCLDRLRQKGLVDDMSFAKSWVESRRRSKKKGSLALKFELIQKGISNEIIAQVLSADSFDDEATLAAQALEKKLSSFNSYDSQKRYQKGIEYLLRKGFSFQVAKEAVTAVLNRL